MKYVLLSVFSLVLLLPTFAQPNLVPNPSFELTGSSTNPYFPVQNWDRPPGSGTTPDAFHTTYSQGTDCTSSRGVPQNGMGYSYPKSGNGYVGFLQFYNQGNQVNSREYIQAQLVSPLQAGLNYRVGLFVKKSPRSTYAINHFGVYLSDTAIHQNFNLPIPVTPQLDLTNVLYDTTNWTLMQMIYTATGGENYITIGNFYTDAACNIPNTGQFDPWCWLNVNAAYHYVDSVYVTATEHLAVDNELQDNVKLYPNPTTGIVHITLPDFQESEIAVYDLFGKVVFQAENQASIDISHLPKGFYVVEVTYQGNIWRKKVWVISEK